MFSLFYNLCLAILALFALPKLLWQWGVLGKYRESLRARLGFSLPNFIPKKGQQVIWLHAVSMGETRALVPLFHLIRNACPNAAIVISTTTETGHAEAKRSMPQAQAHFFLPLDFSWIIRRLLNHIRPTTLILCESDFWYHLLKIAKEKQVLITLVNGKISERSCRRFQKVPFFTRRIFGNFDVLCVQSERHRERFLTLGISPEKIHVTGNLKLDASPQKMSIVESQALKERLGIQEQVLVIGSTHAPEEELILSALQSVWEKLPHLKVLIVPRHPERFTEVANLFQQKKIPFQRFSQEKNHNHRLILIDAMGLLTQCYQIANLAFVGGSFVSHVGGHNIFEPVLYGVPTLFGPHLHSQLDLRELVLNAQAGKETSLDELPQTLLEFLSNPSLRQKHIQACHQLTHSVQGTAARTFQFISPTFEKGIVV